MRLIDADALECISYTGIPDGYDNTFDGGVLWTLDKADEIPSVDAVPVRRGHWISCKSYNQDFKGFKCSECGAQFQGYRPDNYCGNCGAKME